MLLVISTDKDQYLVCLFGTRDKTRFLKAIELKSEYVLGLRTNYSSIKKHAKTIDSFYLISGKII